ncbi:Yip1 family protein [Marinobacter changyiensis]|uniref:Yip1 family protein n=1 Tax=Marinobacter changyiensis TaxID=2604091 RepID=UPI0012652FC3|nr:Yip1 family protein [Marinobacter changyiensis]
MLIGHAFGLFIHPDREWDSIRKEHAPPRRLYVAYVLILALIGPICAYISTAHFGWTVGNERLIKLTEISAFQLSLLTYIAIIVGVFALGYAINWMAKTYGAQEEYDRSNALALASYSCTPLFLAGFALLYPVPWFNAMVFLAATVYGAYLMYDGLPIVMRIPKDQAIMYAGALMTVALVILVATRVGSVLLWNFGFAPQFIQG